MKKIIINSLLVGFLSTLSGHTIQASNPYEDLTTGLNCVYQNTTATTFCFVPDQNTDTNTASSRLFEIGMVALGAALGPTLQTYIIDPVATYAIGPCATKVYKAIAPRVRNGYEKMHSCIPSIIPSFLTSNYSHPGMNDLEKILRPTLEFHWIRHLKDIDTILLEEKWVKQPIVYLPRDPKNSQDVSILVEEQSSEKDDDSISSQNSQGVDDLSLEKNLIGYQYTGFNNRACYLSIIRSNPDLIPKEDIYKLHHSLNKRGLFTTISNENPHKINNTINILNISDDINILESKLKSLEEQLKLLEEQLKLLEEEKIKKTKKTKLANPSPLKKEIYDLNIDLKLKKSADTMYKRIFKSLDTKTASIITGIISAEGVQTCIDNDEKSLYVVLPCIDGKTNQHSYIKLKN